MDPTDVNQAKLETTNHMRHVDDLRAKNDSLVTLAEHLKQEVRST